MTVSSRVRIVALLFALGLPASGCAERSIESRRGGPAAAASGERPVDAALFAFLSKARAAHHRADLEEARGNVPGAILEVARITSGPRPAVSPEVAEVLADAHARLADLRSQVGDFDRASLEIDAGLALAPGITHFRGHLFEVRGVVEERRMRAAETAGDPERARLAKKAALDAFEEAIAIQDRVIREALPGDEGRGGGGTDGGAGGGR